MQIVLVILPIAFCIYTTAAAVVDKEYDKNVQQAVFPIPIRWEARAPYSMRTVWLFSDMACPSSAFGFYVGGRRWFR